MIPKRFLTFLVALGVVSALPLTVKRLIKPKTPEEIFRFKSPEKIPPTADGMDLAWTLTDKKRMFDFESPATRQALEEFPNAHMITANINMVDPGADSFPLLPNMEQAKWSEILNPQDYKDLVREMRVPVKTFNERRYNALLRELGEKYNINIQ